MIGLPIDHRSTLRLLSNTSCHNEVDWHGGAHRPSPADCRAENQPRHEFASKKGRHSDKCSSFSQKWFCFEPTEVELLNWCREGDLNLHGPKACEF